MKKVIVTTSINGPTEAIRKFAAMECWQLVDVLDRKSPEENGGDKLVNTIYLSCDDQEKMDRKLSDLIGWNCIQRRNFGFLYAIKELKADIVATVDDDNIPNYGWGTNVMIGKDTEAFGVDCKADCFDPVGFASDNVSKLWHRGFPIQLLSERTQHFSPTMQKINADVQADFWNGDPDIDAICRMEHAPNNWWFPSYRFPFFSNKPSPFNSQNTFLKAAVLPHYFMFPGVGRMDDIWAAYHVESHGFKVIYGRPSVTQKRNDHDLTKDFMAEIQGYEKAIAIVREIPSNKNAVLKRLPDRSLEAFHRYQELIS